MSSATPCYFSAPDRLGRSARGEQIPIPLDPARASTTAVFDHDLESSRRPRDASAGENADESVRSEAAPVGQAGERWISLVPWMDEVGIAFCLVCFSPWLKFAPLAQIPVNLSQDTPMEVVVQMFQRLGLRFVLLTRRGVLAGMLTKMVRLWSFVTLDDC